MSELDRLRARVAELEDALGLTAEIPPQLVPPELIGKTASRRRTLQVVGVLLERPFAPRDILYEVIYGGMPECDQPDPKIIHVLVCYARRGLSAYGVTVTTMTKKGWYISEPDKAKLRAVIDGLNERAA